MSNENIEQLPRMRINLGLDEKVNLGNYESTGGSNGISIEIPITHDLPKVLSSVIDKVYEALDHDNNVHKLIEIIVKNKDKILSKNVKLATERVTKTASLKNFYINK